MPNKEVYIKNYKVEKEYGSGLAFDGVNDHIVIGNPSKLLIAGNITVEAWVRFNVLNLDQRIAHRFNDAVDDSFLFRLATTGQLALVLRRLDNGGYHFFNTPAGLIRANEWYHVAFTHTNGVNTVLYINGVAVTTTAHTLGMRAGNSQFKIGNISGYIQEVRVWNIVRTQQQISQNKNKKLTGNESGLVGYYRLNEGTGITAFDSSLSPANGTLTNFPTNPWSTSVIAPIHKRTYKGISEYEFSSITSNINNGYGDVGFSLPKKFDDFGSGVTTGLDGYEADIIVYDRSQVTGQTIFSGEIAKIKRNLASDEKVDIVALGPLFRLEKTPLITATGSHQVTYTSLDLAEMIRQVLACYNSQQFFSQITYTASSLPNTGLIRTISFDNATCLDAIQSIFKMTASNQVWFLDVDRVFYLKTISSTPVHYFFLGKDIISLGIDESKLEIINDLAFWNGGSLAREYRNQASIDKYGLFFDRKRDDRYTTTASMDSYGQRVVATQNTPNLQVEITILDSNSGGYDLESIKVGDTCKILNIADTSGLSGNMVITKKADYLDYAVLTIADVASYTSRELYNLKKTQQMVNYDSGPATYTLV